MARFGMRMRISFVLIVVALTFASAAFPAPVQEVAGVPARVAAVSIDDPSANLVVEVSTGAAFRAVRSIAERFGASVQFASEETGIMSIGGWAGSQALLSELSALEGVVSLSSEHKARAMFVPNDPLRSRQWALDMVNAYEAWDITRGNHSVVIAVLDTGIDWTHPDLEANMWSDEDGYHGYNFISNNRLPMDDNINSYDENGVWVPNTYTYHGTHIAGVASAVIDNSVGVSGMAQALLMAVKVMNESGEGTDTTVSSGIRWAVDHGADIVTMSLGVEGMSLTLTNAVNYASSHGVVLVAASGNSGTSTVSYPAAYQNVIAVGAVDETGRRAEFSNYGTGLDLVAPGVQIYSTQAGSSYQYLSGTSTAAPFVAGVIAMMLSVDPYLTPGEISTILNATAQDVSIPGYDTSTGWGIVDAFRAVAQVSNPRVTINEHPEYAPINGTISVTWTVTGGSPGVISGTYLAWGESPSDLDHSSANFSGRTPALFTVDEVQSLEYNGTLYLRAVATVDGTEYESELLALPVREPVPDGLFAQFLQDVQKFIFEDLGVVNFAILMVVLIAVPVIIVAARPRRRRERVYYQAPAVELERLQALPSSQYLPPPPPPPPRYEAYVDLLGHEIMPPTLRVVEGTKVVWVNRSWAPPPGISIRSGRLDESGEHHDGMFQSGLLIAPGDYWSATFHRAGEYEYYVTGIWKRGRIIVEAYRPTAQTAS